MLLEGLERVGAQKNDCKAICLGFAGIGRPGEKEILSGMMHSMGFDRGLIITNDAHIALMGGTGAEMGIILISGTGSICYGCDGYGNTCRSGGWGYIAGDEGSGYDIGLHALKHTLKVLDGREKNAKSILAAMVMEALDVDTPDKLIHMVYHSGEGKKKIASLAPVVDKANLSGDGKAAEILECAVSELFLCASSVIDRLHFQQELVPLVFSGSVLQKSTKIRNNLKNKLKTAYPMVSVQDSENDAAWGAVLMALRHINGKELAV